MEKISLNQLMILMLFSRAYYLFTAFTAENGLSTEGNLLILLTCFVLQSLLLRLVLRSPSEHSKANHLFSAVMWLLCLSVTCWTVLSFEQFCHSSFAWTGLRRNLSLILLSASVFLIIKGLEGTARAAFLLMFPLLFLLLLSIIMSHGTYNFFQYTRYSSAFSNYAPVLLRELLSSAEIPLMAELYVHTTATSKKHSHRWLFWSLITALLVRLIVAFTLGQLAGGKDYPLIFALSYFQTSVIQRPQAIFLIFWSVTALFRCTLFLSKAVTLSCQLFPVFSPRQSIILNTGIAALICLICSIAGSSELLQNILFTASCLLTLIIFILSGCQRKESRNE